LQALSGKEVATPIPAAAVPWSFSEEAAAEKYMAQVQHNMWVFGGAIDPHGPTRGKEILSLRAIW
jgi:hypothetical protein